MKTSKLALASLACGSILFINFLGLLGFLEINLRGIITLYFSLQAIVFGIIALVKISKNKDTLKGSAFAISGIVLGGLFVVLTVISAISRSYAGVSHEIRKPAQCRSDLENIKVALNLYELDIASLPATEEGLAALLTNLYSDFPYPGPYPWNGPYLKDMPLDPWGRAYQYRSPGKEGTEYDLYSLGKDGKESKDDISIWDLGR